MLHYLWFFSFVYFSFALQTATAGLVQGKDYQHEQTSVHEYNVSFQNLAPHKNKVGTLQNTLDLFTPSSLVLLEFVVNEVDDELIALTTPLLFLLLAPDYGQKISEKPTLPPFDPLFSFFTIRAPPISAR